MRIAFIVEGFPILSQTFVLNQVTGLIDLGHEVDIYAELQSDTPQIHPDVEKYNLINRTYYHPSLPKNKLKRLLMGLQLFILGFFKDPWLILQSINIFRYGKDAASLRMLYAVTPLLGKRSAYDIIQCHFGPLGNKGMLLRSIGAIKGKLITAFHGVDISQNLQIFGEDYYMNLLKEGDLFLPISNRWQNRLIELGCQPSKIVVHRMGIDCNRFLFMTRSPNSDGCIRLVTIARLTEKKGVEYGIRAVAALLKDGHRIEYNIIGNGDLQNQLEQLIQDLEVSDQIHLLGWKDQAEIVNILNQSHILLAPSVTAQDGNQEGIPVALMEAMAMGMPVISTYHSGIPELVEHEVSGFLVPEQDTDALAKALSDLINHPERWAEMGRAGRLRVEEHYDINRLNDRLVTLYQHLLESGTSYQFVLEPEAVISDRPTPANL
jgi:colanic acid/amylovoran biosynthesis glycosyltransferase